MSRVRSIGAVILAAGSSSRLGQPKQLVQINSTYLLQRVILAIRIPQLAGPTVVVLGAKAEAIRDSLGHPDAHDGIDWIENTNWREGMGTSLSCGIQHLEKTYPQNQAVLISVCDQPYLDENIIRKLISKSDEFPDQIVASSYGKTTGPPVIFPRQYFSELAELTGDKGAKKVLLNHIENVIPLDFPKGEIEIDTAADLGNCKI